MAVVSPNRRDAANDARAEERWQKVKSRQPDPSRPFVYAVKTTGVYCLPGCGSRLPRRENVLFFETSHEARSAGYRACKRCRPDQKSESAATQAVRTACEQMAESEQPVRLAALAAAAGFSPGHFQRLFKRITGITPKAYAQMIQSQRLPTELANADSVTRAALGSSGSPSQFYRTAKESLGMKPEVYRAGAKGEQIQIASAETALGMLVIAATERGICAIELGDDAAPLQAKLRERFAQAELCAASPAVQSWLAELVAHLQQPQAGLQLPLDIQGTVFQRRVWEALQTIPPGETRTYSQLAQQIGKPQAVRAVASACAANKLAIAIPCHRAVRADGQISGYRWGVERKAKLLEREEWRESGGR